MKKAVHSPLQESKGPKFEEVKFENNFESATLNLKTFASNISKKSKELNDVLSNINFGPTTTNKE